MRVLRRTGAVWIYGLLLLLLVFAAQTRQAAQESLQLCAAALLPALFPFSVAVQLLQSTGADRPLARLLRRPLGWLGLPAGAAAPILCGLIGGYPIGLQALAGAVQAGQLRWHEAIRVSQICNNAGPAFVLGAAGLSLFGSARAGLSLWLVQLIAFLLSAILLRAFAAGHPAEVQSPPRVERPASAPSLTRALPEAVRSSALAMLSVCGFVLFFGSLRALLQQLPLPDGLLAVLSAASELAGGLFSLAVFAPAPRFVLSSILLSWGGLCVHFQGAAFLQAAGLPLRPYLSGKLLQSACAGLIASMYVWLFRF